MITLGRSRPYGFIGVDPDLSTESIASGKVIDAVVGNTLVSYITSDTQAPGGVLLASGNYANPLDVGGNSEMFKTQSTESKVIIDTNDFTITPPSGGRVSIQGMVGIGGTNNTFSITADGNSFISPGSKNLLPGNSAISADNDFKVGNSSGGGGVNFLCFGVDEAVVINKGASANIALTYNIEVPDA